MTLRQQVILLAQLSILCTVFGFGLKTTGDDLLYLIRRPRLLARSLLAIYVVMPIVAVVLVRFFEFRQAVEIAIVALAISPVPPLLPQRQTRAGGEAGYAIGLMAILALLAIVVSPLAVKVLESVFDRSLAIAPGAVARLALITVVLPLAAGTTVRATAPKLAASIDNRVALTAKVLLPLAVLGLIVIAGPAMLALVGNGTLIAMTVFLAAGLATGHVLGGPEPENAVVLALSTACRHPAIAFTIASANFPEERAGAAILLYVVLSLIVGVPYLAWRRRSLRSPATADV